MPPDETPTGVAAGASGDPALVAAAVRAGIDALLAERAPGEREAFWRAVALYYAPPQKDRTASQGPHPERPEQPSVTQAAR